MGSGILLGIFGILSAQLRRLALRTIKKVKTGHGKLCGPLPIFFLIILPWTISYILLPDFGPTTALLVQIF